MPCCTYLSRGLMNNKRWVRLFQILQKERLVFLLDEPGALWGDFKLRSRENILEHSFERGGY